MAEDNIETSYLVIYDNTPSARINYASSSISDVLGYTSEEVLGMSFYQFLHPDDNSSIQKVHMSNVFNEKLSSMISYRLRHKLGYYVKIATVVHYSHEVLLTCNMRFNPDALQYKQWMNTADECFLLTEEENQQASSLSLVSTVAQNRASMEDALKRSLQVSRQWTDKYEPEPRFYVLLNRYSAIMTITFISHMVTKLLGGMPPDDYIGRSIYEVVHPRDRDVVEAQCAAVKSLYVISRVRFDWLIDMRNDVHVSVEAVVSATRDTLVMVVRSVPAPVQV
ncbi:hypothetical protein BC940DRAFT_302505 [Gongronella butleri]|nr:hypothetical protein BC940DRAFT_302505 [Gongronella butleri]